MTNQLVLKNKRILVTRPKHQAAQLSSKLKIFGAEVTEIPVIEITPPDSWQPLDSALARIYEFDWLLLASGNAVESVVNRLKEYGQTIKALQGIKLAVIGPATSDVLSSFGIKATFCPSQFIAETLVEEFPEYPNMSNLNILWPRTNVGRNYIIDKFKEAGAEIEVVPAYKTMFPNDPNIASRIAKLLEEKRLDIITLTSAQGAKNLSKLLQTALSEKSKDASLKTLLKDVKIATIGPETSNAAKENLGKVDIEAKRYTIDGLVEAICQ